MTAETSAVSELAARYAAALFELARDERQLDEVSSDLARIEAMLDESDDLRRAVRSPVIDRDALAAAVAAIMEQAGVGSLTKRFIAVVGRHRRLFALGPMIRAFRALLADHRGEVAAEVTSARTLNEAQLEAVKRALAQSAGRDVNVTAKVDSDLIGGLVVRMGSRMVDSSVRTKLERLRFAMKGVA